MDFELQPDFAAWIERESGDLPALVQDLTDLATAARTTAAVPDERAVLTIDGKDIIGEPIVSQTDIAGKLVTRFFWKEGRFLGLTDEKLVKVLKFAERISLRKEIQDILSAETIREIVLEWVGDTVRNGSTDPIVARIHQTVRDRVKSLVIWIPIEETQVGGELKFADSTLKMVSRRELDALLEPRLKHAPAEAAPLMREKLHRAWLGKAAMCFSLEAEPKRAEELALEKAENYMALLQIYGLAPTVLPLISYAAPAGARPRRMRRSMAISQGSFAHASEGVVDQTYYLIFDYEYQAVIENLGLSALSRLASGPTCDYEEAVLKSLLVYGRACYQADPTDKLLQIITAIEMFALRDDNEPISASVADRVAFAVATGTAQRLSVAKNFKHVYSIRSKKTHHGHTISDTEAIEIFLRNVWEFFLSAIQVIGRYKTRADFLDYLEHLKYS